MPASGFTLVPPAPYSLARTTERYARFEEAVDRVAGGAYARLLFADGAPVLVRVRQEGPPGRAALRVELAGAGAGSDAGRAAARRHLERALGVASDLGPFYRAFRGDPLLGAALRDYRGMRVAGFGDAFEACVTAILTQQVNLRFAFSIRADLARSCGRRARIDGETWIGFPTARRLARETPAALRRFRLSQAKAEAIHRVATAFASGELDDAALRALPDDDVVERLTALRGIGRWTAETVLIRGLGRLDAFPAADLGIVKYLAQGLLGRRSPATEAQMRAFAERWRPYRAVALVYAYAELGRRRASRG
jgi:DNA-3-methyladenine glycosylase II